MKLGDLRRAYRDLDARDAIVEKIRKCKKMIDAEQATLDALRAERDAIEAKLAAAGIDIGNEVAA